MANAARFTQLHLENWRNFARVAADLEQRVAVIGPSASGKTNLLDAFRFLHDIAAVGGGFQAAVAARGGVPRLRCLAAGRNSDVLIRIRAANQFAWEYELAFTHSEELQCPVIQRERISNRECDVFCRPDQQDRKDPERLTGTYLEQSTANRECRELVEYFRSIRYLNIVPALVRDPARSVRQTNDPLGGDLIAQMAATPEATQHARLRRIRQALVDLVPQLSDLQMWRDAQGAPHLRARYEHWRSRGAWHTEEEFSDGTLRLIGLLWAALDSGGPLLIEEPELSLDPRMVRAVPDLVARMLGRSGRQAILTTHSTEMLEGNAFEPAEVLLLTPGEQGTEVHAAVEFPLIRRVMAEGLRLAELNEPATLDERQIPLFESLTPSP